MALNSLVDAKIAVQSRIAASSANGYSAQSLQYFLSSLLPQFHNTSSCLLLKHRPTPQPPSPSPRPLHPLPSSPFWFLSSSPRP